MVFPISVENKKCGRPWSKTDVRTLTGEVSPQPVPISIEVDERQVVSGLLSIPEHARALYVMAHGAGAGMTRPFMAAVADGLFDRGVATLRYQFPYMEQGSRRPDRPALAHATVRAAVDAAAGIVPSLPLFAGGTSFGGRMTSQAQAAAPLPTVRGLAFFSFPLHPPGKPSIDRAAHLSDVRIPMLFLQGTRDDLAQMELLAPTVERLGERATLAALQNADHSFHVLVRSGRTHTEVISEALDRFVLWTEHITERT